VEQVIERARSGDADALGHLWRTYNHLLLRYFRGKGMAEPEDLASTVWVEVASSLPRFEGSEYDFRRWLFTIAARRRIDDIRSTKRQEARTQRDRQTTIIEYAPDAQVVADQAAAIDRALAIIRTLPSDQAEAVLLRVIGELGIAEVAAIMGASEGNVRVLVHRGLKRLAEPAAKTSSQLASDPAVVTNQPRPTMSST
jgi:RNA polymerase sigma-70 factor, ECF subfamily